MGEPAIIRIVAERASNGGWTLHTLKTGEVVPQLSGAFADFDALLGHLISMSDTGKVRHG